jgi:hypothetical protein
VSVPHSLDDRARHVIERERARIEGRATELRQLQMHLRSLLAEVDAELGAGTRRLLEIEEMLGLSPQLPIDALDHELSGRRLRDFAVDVLRRHRGTGEPIHYRRWLELVEGTGAKVGGKDPAATFLTQINKSSQIESVRPRSGLYQLKPTAS